MLFSEIYNPPSQQPQMSEDQMRQARINRWGTDAVGPRDAFSEDYSDKFNTVLAPDEEEKYQAWATENHREKDVYDYDLRGAWKELQSGTMSEDERGHLGDKYKKPNHPTFSDQSIYSGQDGVTGGVWSRNAEGKDVYTPGRKLSSVEADRLRRYFLRNEPGVVLDLKDKVFEERPLPGVNTPLGVFSGLGDTWKGIPAAVLQTASSAITAFKNTGADILSRMGTDETRAWWEGQKAVMDQNARDIRDYNKVHFEVDPETMGTASQIIYGLFKTLPKAMGYGLAGGVSGGALAFGADVGIDETNRLMDEGVDRDTAINAGLVSFGMNAIGMRLPAVLGASRGMSMAYGAVANAGTNVAEVEGIKFILEHQDYNQLAQQYDLNGVDLAVSAAMGAAFGGAFWRSPEQIRTQKYQDAARLVYEDQRAALFNKGKSQFNFEQAGTQAAINARAVVSLAKRLGIEPDKVRDFSAKIVWSEDGKSAEVPKEAFNMPYTQGKEWHMGPTKASPDEQVTVVQYKGQAADRASAMNEAASLATNGLKNEETGFVLTASKSDLNKAVGSKFSFDEHVFRAVAPVLDEVVAKARLMESTPDLTHKNPDVQGIHYFATPVEIDGRLYRVQLVVRDYVIPKQERLATHKISGIQIYEIENPPVSRTDDGLSDIRGVVAPNIRLSSKPTASSDHVISLSQLAGGRKPYRRQDGKGLFDEVDKASRTEGGAYFESPSFNQIIGETGVRNMDARNGEFYQVAYHGSPYLFDKFTLDHIGEGEGAQAHGWGLYFALDRATAEGYQKRLAPSAHLPEEFDRYAEDKKRQKAIRSELDLLEKDMERIRKEATEDEQSAAELAENERDAAEMRSELEAELSAVNARIADYEKPEGRLYQVEIPDDDVMLREENYFDDQPEKVQEAVRKIFEERDSQYSPDNWYDDYDSLLQANGLDYMKGVADALYDFINAGRGEIKENLRRVIDVTFGLVEKDVADYYASRGLNPNDSNNPASAMQERVKKSIQKFIEDWMWEEHVPRINYQEMTGRDIYETIGDFFGSDKDASEQLSKKGVKGIRYDGFKDGECAVVWDEKAIEMREFLQKALQDGEIRGSFNPQTNTIKLTPNANLSTFSHEHSHWYLTNLFAHAADENISPEARADIDALLKAFGLKSVEEYNALPFEQKVKLQERYAAWTERYLAEGKVPAGYLQGMFRNFARWLMDMYRDLIGEGAGDDAAKKEIGERYKAQFGENLPELSKEVRRVLDRMYDAENKMASFRSNSGQVTAARVIQAQRTNNQKVTAPLQDGSAPEVFTKALRAQEQAAEAMNSGEQVDVSQTMKNVPVNDATVRQGKNAFAKSFQMGDTGTIVVLQNRDRTGAVSVGQMNAIATAPDYTRLSVSRTTDSGAPIVSFGTLPDSQYLGNTETVADGSHKIPMTYAVVEADSVLRSNNFDGTPVPEYGTDPSRMHAIAGNGRMAGLSEAYNRGTAEQYRQDLMADAQSVGINPEVVAGMQHPVLVRIMPPEAVETGFIERSNSSNVLEKSALETAVQDSPRIRNNVWKYQFDEDGAPTPETVRQFTIDIGEPNSLGKLLTADGRPTETATNRLRAAVFYEAYRDRTLTALVADDTDKQGIKRILNAMAAFAPHVINIREASNGAVDLGPVLVDVVNRIRNAKIEGTPLESIIGQGDVFGDNPAVQQLLGFIAENQNSAAAIARVFEPFAAAVENRLKSSGNGPQGGLFGEAENVSTDLADVMGIFRDTQNRLISEANAAMRESGATEGFREALPAVDVETMRDTLQALAEAQRPAEKVVESVVETVTEKTSPEASSEAAAQAADVETQQQARQAHEQSVFSDNADRVQVESLAEINPDMVYEWQDDDGNTIQMTARDVLETDAAIDAEANKDMAAMGTAAMCIYRNNGITE